MTKIAIQEKIAVFAWKGDEMLHIPLTDLPGHEGKTLECHTELDADQVKTQIQWLRDRLNEIDESWTLEDFISLLPYKAEIKTKYQMMI